MTERDPTASTGQRTGPSPGASTSAITSATSGRTGPTGADQGLGGSGLQTTRGRTTIADSVVAKIAGMAAREIPGEHSMGTGAARALGAVRSRLPGQSTQARPGRRVGRGRRVPGRRRPGPGHLVRPEHRAGHRRRPRERDRADRGDDRPGGHRGQRLRRDLYVEGEDGQEEPEEPRVR
jgi:hypothetical protein